MRRQRDRDIIDRMAAKIRRKNTRLSQEEAKKIIVDLKKRSDQNKE